MKIITVFSNVHARKVTGKRNEAGSKGDFEVYFEKGSM
jgi:hypothetical protein